MRCSWSRALPACLAAFLLCVLPSCASMPDGLFDAAYAKAAEESRKPINFDLKPVAEGVPPGIERGAGMDFEPPNLHGSDEAWGYLVLLVVYIIVYAGYGFAWCCVKAVEALIDACKSDPPEECDECENEDEESSESQSP